MLFAHLPAGYLLAEGLRKNWQKKFSLKKWRVLFWAVIISSILPDIDLFYFYFYDSQTIHHSYFTHVPLFYLAFFAVLWALGYLIKIFFKQEQTFKFLKCLGLAVLLGVLLHIVLDTWSGTQLLWPFSKKIYGLDVMRNSSLNWERFLISTRFLEILITLVAIEAFVLRKIKTTYWRWAAFMFFLFLAWGSFKINYFAQQHTYSAVNIYVSDENKNEIINLYDEDMDGDGVINVLDNDADNNGLSNLEDIKQAADKLIGIWRDPLDNHFGNIGGRLGLISNFEAVAKPYAQAGIFFSEESRRDFQKNYTKYDKTDNNNPKNYLFGSQPKNLWVYLKNNGWLCEVLEKVNCPIAPGDIIFFKNSAGLIAALATKINGDQYEAIISDESSWQAEQQTAAALEARYGSPLGIGHLPSIK